MLARLKDRTQRPLVMRLMTMRVRQANQPVERMIRLRFRLLVGQR